MTEQFCSRFLLKHEQHLRSIRYHMFTTIRKRGMFAQRPRCSICKQSVFRKYIFVMWVDASNAIWSVTQGPDTHHFDADPKHFCKVIFYFQNKPGLKEGKLSKFYREINPVFSEVKKLLHLVLTYPITSNEAERSFSKLKLLLASTRSAMGEARLNNLALMGTHKSRLTKVSTEKIIQKFKEKPRTAKLHTKIVSSIYILSSDSD